MQKVLCAVHDKKSDMFEGFVVYNNTNEALRSFQMTCEQNETFKKWPEDFQLILVAKLNYVNGKMNEKNEIVEKGHFEKTQEYFTPIAEATDFVKKNETLHVDLHDAQSTK